MEQCTPGPMTMEQRPPTRLAHETCDVLAALDRIEGDRELPVPWSSWGIPSHHGPYTNFIGRICFFGLDDLEFSEISIFFAIKDFI